MQFNQNSKHFTELCSKQAETSLKELIKWFYFWLKKCCKRKIPVLHKLLINKGVNKVEYSRVYIFHIEKRFFASLHGNIKL